MKKLILIFVLFTSYSAFAQVHSVDSIKDKKYLKAIRTAEKYIDSLQATQRIPGVSVSVGTTTKILWSEGFGYSDLETLLPVSIHSKFRMGSVSKSITSVAVGKLVEDKKLDLDAPIQQYVPDFPVKKFSFTSRQLATHTAGIRHYGPNDPIACPKRYRNVHEGLSIFDQDTLLFKPGTAYNYSTYGYSVLSAVIEGASGSDYSSYMRTNVFKPIGMTETSPDYSDSIVVNRVRFYEKNKDGIVNAALVDNSYKWAGGGLLSTPSDLVKMGTALIGNKLLSKETTSILFTPQLLANGKNTNYGFGWRIETDNRGRKILHHGGLSDGGRTFLLLFPDHDLVVAIAANISGANINLPEAEKIANIFFDTVR